MQKAGGSVVLPAFKQLVPKLAAAASRSTSTGRCRNSIKHAWSAIVNVAVEPDGLVRRYSFGETLDGKFLPSVGALLAGKYESTQAPLRIDFSIRPESLPTVSYVDVLRGDPAAIEQIKGKKVIIGATAIELGDRFSVPNGRVIPGPQLQMLAAESILQGRVLRARVRRHHRWPGLASSLLLMLLLWRRAVRRLARGRPGRHRRRGRSSRAMLLQAKFAIILDTSLWHLAIAAYLAAMALDEIDFRSLLGGIAEKRFQRIAMSLGDGLVCADQNGLITVWNPGAVAIFGYSRTR